MSATIIFSDGSKRTAQQLDDRYERWLERKAAEADAVAERMIKHGIAVPDCADPASVEQALRWQAGLKNLKAGVNAAIQRVKKQSRSRLEAQRRGAGLVEAQVEIDRQLSGLKQYLAAAQREGVAADLRYENERLAGHVRYLEAILRAERIRFEAWEES